MKDWVFYIALTYKEFDNIDKAELLIFSNWLTMIFDVAVRKWPSSNGVFDPLNMDECVSIFIMISLHWFERDMIAEIGSTFVLCCNLGWKNG